MTDFLLIETTEALAAQARIWATRPWLAVDTEFVREETYYPELCLIQVSDGQTAACVDVLALTDLAPLLDVLYRNDILKVFHAAGQDLEVFVQLAGDCPRPLFDTQIAAAMLGFGEQLGYAGLVAKLLGVELDKSHARTDWSRRPLPAAALRYAADDVRHLAVIHPRLRAELESRGRWDWLEEDCARLTTPAFYRTVPDDAWQRVKGLGHLPAVAQHRAAALAAWRETEAQTRNRPRRWILSDEALCALALRCPQTVEELAQMDLTPKQMDRYPAALLKILGSPAPDTLQPLTHNERPTAAERTRTQRLMETLRGIATAQNLPPSLIAPRADIEALARTSAPGNIPVLRGWRRQIAGEALLKACASR